MVLKPEKEKEAEAIFRKWGLDFAVVGETTPSKRFIVRHGGDVMADLPIKELGDQAPEYKRPFVSAAKPKAIEAEDVAPPRSPCSTRSTFRPRPAASRAIPQPLIPPPAIARSNSVIPSPVTLLLSSCVC